MPFLILVIVEIILLYLLSHSLTSHAYHLFYRLTGGNKKRTLYLFALFFLPGTFIHELSHFFMALILMVPVQQMELMPQVNEEEKGIKMGSIPIGETDFIRRALVGIAPFVLGLGAILGLMFYLTGQNLLAHPWWILLISGYLIFEVSNTMFTSRTDLEGTLELFLLILILYLLYWFISQNLFTINLEFVPTQTLVSYLQKSTLFLAIPLSVNFIILILLKFLRSRLPR